MKQYNEEIIELGKYHKTYKVHVTYPLIYDGKVIGCVYTSVEDKRIMNSILNKPNWISSRKTDKVLADITLIGSNTFI